MRVSTAILLSQLIDQQEERESRLKETIVSLLLELQLNALF